MRDWHAKLDPGTPTLRAHSYALLKAICATAVTDDLLIANPCRIGGAGQSKRVSTTEPASLEKLVALVDAMPSRYQAMTLLAAWSRPALRGTHRAARPRHRHPGAA